MEPSKCHHFSLKLGVILGSSSFLTFHSLSVINFVDSSLETYLEPILWSILPDSVLFKFSSSLSWAIEIAPQLGYYTSSRLTCTLSPYNPCNYLSCLKNFNSPPFSQDHGSDSFDLQLQNYLILPFSCPQTQTGYIVAMWDNLQFL